MKEVLSTVEVRNKNSHNVKTYALDSKNIFILFVLGSVIGTLYEELVHFMKYGNYEQRRALLWGPFNPLYGIGFIIFIIFLYKNWHKRTRAINFIYCMFLGGGCEFFSSVITETLFGIKAWDYSNHFLNVFGKTTIPFSIFWGIAGYIIVEFIYPNIEKKLTYILVSTKKRFCHIVGLFMIVNVIATLVVVQIHVNRMNDIEMRNPVFQMIDHLYSEEYIEKKFPNWEYIKQSKMKEEEYYD